MANLLRMKKVAAHANEREFPFVVQVVVPDGGFDWTLNAINAWHHYSRHPQRRGRRYYEGEREFWRWCFEGLEVAKAFRHQFGGEIMPITVRGRANRRPDLGSRACTAEQCGRGAAEGSAERKLA